MFRRCKIRLRKRLSRYLIAQAPTQEHRQILGDYQRNYNIRQDNFRKVFISSLKLLSFQNSGVFYFDIKSPTKTVL